MNLKLPYYSNGIPKSSLVVIFKMFPKVVSINSDKEFMFDLVIKTHEFYVRDYGFKIHKVNKSSILKYRDLKCVGRLETFIHISSKNKFR